VDRGVEPVLKHLPGDFQVEEVPSDDFSHGSHPVVRVKKAGLTTLQAIDHMSRRWEVPRLGIAHAGMKDEDAVSTQFMSLPPGTRVEAFGPVSVGPSAFLEARHIGHLVSPLRIGRLLGNIFRITVRNLTADMAVLLHRWDGQELHAINYYDTQRFGIAGGPSITHLIGEAIEKHDFALARRLVEQSGSPESAQALAHVGAAEELFDGIIDPRQVAFYLSAASSWSWNSAIAKHVATADPRNKQVQRAGLPYTFPIDNTAAVIASVRAGLSLPYCRVAYDSITGRFVRTQVFRPSLMNVRIMVDPPVEDEYFVARRAVTLRFALPAGSYATMAIAHLMHFVWKSPCEDSAR
jgi:tRNA pseudouridine13 synthase